MGGHHDVGGLVLTGHRQQRLALQVHRHLGHQVGRMLMHAVGQRGQHHVGLIPLAHHQHPTPAPLQEAQPERQVAHHQNAHQPQHRGNGEHAAPHFRFGEDIEERQLAQQRHQVRREHLLHHQPEGFILLTAVQTKGRHRQHHQCGKHQATQRGEDQAVLVQQPDLVAEHHRGHQHQGIDDRQDRKTNSEVMDECAHVPKRGRQLPEVPPAPMKPSTGQQDIRHGRRRAGNTLLAPRRPPGGAR